MAESRKPALQEVRKEKKNMSQKPKRERILESSLMELPAAAKRLRKTRADMCDLIW